MPFKSRGPLSLTLSRLMLSLLLLWQHLVPLANGFTVDPSLLDTSAISIIQLAINSSQADDEVIRINSYHDHEQLEELLNTLDKSDIAAKYRIGRSINGREVDGLKLSGGKGALYERPLLKPMVKYVGNMHGNEAVGRELILALATYLVHGYGQNERVTKLLDDVEVHLVPTMNPDGFYRVNRHNINGKDLNRNFPTWRDIGLSREDLKEGREPETQMMIDYIMDNPFVLSINFHDGATVTNYPWDEKNVRNKRTSFNGPSTKSDLFLEDGEGNRTPDKEVFESLAKLYSSNNPKMKTGNSCYDSVVFRDGITNGVDWYEVIGGMQDFNYMFTNCMELTVEVSCVKKPEEKMLQTEWKNNKESLLAFLESVRDAAHGLVTDGQGSPVKDARVQVEGLGKLVTTTERGEFWRMLTPGAYRIKGSKQVGTKLWESVWVAVNVAHGATNRVDLQLTEVTEVTTTTKAPDAQEESTNEDEQDLKIELIPGYCVSISLFQLPRWCSAT